MINSWNIVRISSRNLFLVDLLFDREFPLVVTQLLKNVVEGGKPWELNSNPVGFSIRRALASAARWAITAEKFTSNRGSTVGDLTEGLFERRSVVGDGGGGKPVEGGIFSSMTISFTWLSKTQWWEKSRQESIKPEDDTFFKRVFACSISFWKSNFISLEDLFINWRSFGSGGGGGGGEFVISLVIDDGDVLLLLFELR